LEKKLYAYSYAPKNNFSVGHPSSNRSRPSTLNLEFFSDELPEKKVYLIDMSVLSILLSPGLGCHRKEDSFRWMSSACGVG
jgi:hypothetical protein